jgi:2-oxoglutarate dehydrogenase E2 component (dihydrolipoamide succinyltransferase)
MTIDITVPALGESVTEATVSRWLKAPGDAVVLDEPLVELETDKIAIEVNAATPGTLADIVVAEGENVEVGALLGHLEPGAGKPSEPAPVGVNGSTQEEPVSSPAAAEPVTETGAGPALSPAVRHLIDEHGLDPSSIAGTGRDGRIVKSDVLAAVAARGTQAAPSAAQTATPVVAAPVPTATAPSAPRVARPTDPREERVPMSRLRRRAAERLKLAQNTAAMLTTFNEVDMTNVMALRATHRDDFEKKHGVRLGFMSFFVRAAVVALREFPLVNAEIDGDDIVYKRFFNIGVAVSAPQGLIVPVLRDVDQMSFAGIEQAIRALGVKATENKLAIEDLIGGTFTISNGGVFGSLMSTPIINPPQSAILGMHKIQERPVAVDGAVEIRPMMYLALSYDHRLIDGREAVTFLIRIKECIEDPQRILLDL